MVTITTGMSASSGSLLRLASTPQPSSPGISTSSVIAPGRTERARARPSLPLDAHITWKPSLARKRASRSRTAGSSSMTSTVLDADGAAGDRARPVDRLRAGSAASCPMRAGISNRNVEP